MQAHGVMVYLLIFAMLFLVYQYVRKANKCRYCGGEWMQHEDHCPYKNSGTLMR